MSLPRYTVSMLCCNKLPLTQACVASVLQHSGPSYEFIITDNGSTDGTREWLASLASRHPSRIHVVTNTRNLGFKEPHAHALTLAKGEYFVLLNNDMVVCEGWLEGLAAPFTGNPRMAITGVAGTCNALTRDLRAHIAEPPEYVEGSCLMIPTGLARRIGLFAPYLRFIYWEDTELSFRVREMGYEIAHVELPMRHDKPGSTSSTIPECQEALKHNTEQMKKRWGWYFKRRDLTRRILVRRLGAHGDVLLATPALQALHERYPQAEIGLVTKCPSMVRGISWLTTATKRTNYYDTFIDLDRSYEERPEVHIVQAFADKLEVELPKRWQMVMAASEEDEAWAERTSRGAKLAVVHAGQSCWPGKNWVLEQDGTVSYKRWVEVVAELRKRGYVVATVGDDHAPKLACDLPLAGETTPQQLYALCKRARLFMGIDSMPQHVASAADTPSVVLFGPTNPRAIVRPTPRIKWVQADVAQVPCVGEHGRRTTPITSVPCRGDCMRAISVEQVLRAVESVERLTA